MQKVTTTSGATYIVDGLRTIRVGPSSPFIDYDLVPDGEWTTWEHITEIEEGFVIYMFNNAQDTYRVTTPVETIEQAGSSDTV